jgi:hypothetical protein
MLKYKLSTSLEALSQGSASSATLHASSLRTEEVPQESFADFRAEISAFVNIGSDAKQVETIQHVAVSRQEKQFQESFVDLKAELDVFHELVVRKGTKLNMQMLVHSQKSEARGAD